MTSSVKIRASSELDFCCCKKTNVIFCCLWTICIRNNNLLRVAIVCDVNDHIFTITEVLLLYIIMQIAHCGIVVNSYAFICNAPLSFEMCYVGLHVCTVQLTSLYNFCSFSRFMSIFSS